MPLTEAEKMTLFWHGLFATGLNKCRVSFAKVKNPVELMITIMRLVKDLPVPRLGLREIALEYRYMGQDLLTPPSVEGWHRGSSPASR